MSWRCPRCKASFEEKERCFPFCSDRCKLLDLGAWATGKYFIPGPSVQDEEEEAPSLLNQQLQDEK